MTFRANMDATNLSFTCKSDKKLFYPLFESFKRSALGKKSRHDVPFLLGEGDFIYIYIYIYIYISNPSARVGCATKLIFPSRQVAIPR